MNNAAINIEADVLCVCVWHIFSILQGIYLGVELLGHSGNSMLSF